MRDRSGLALATLVVAGLTLMPAQPAGAEPAPGAAPTVQNEVQVGQPAATPGAAPSTAPAPDKPAGSDLGGPPAKRVLKRNPFVPPVGAVATPAGPAKPTVPSTAGSTTGSQAPGKKQPVEEVAPEAPGFTLAGIFISAGRPAALIATEAGVVEVHVGDTIEGFKVKTISLEGRQVVVEVKKYPFRISLPKDSPFGSNNAGVNGGGAGGGAVALPPSGGASSSGGFPGGPGAPGAGGGGSFSSDGRGGTGGGKPGALPPPPPPPAPSSPKGGAK